MAIRVDREGLTDPVGAGSTSGGARVYDDGTRTEPWAPRPWSSARDFQASDALRLMSMPGEEIAKLRPPVPYQLFPEQELGFVVQPPTIDQILDTERWSPQIRSWLSPTIQRPNTRADYQENVWSGTARNVSMSVNPML